MVRFYTPSGYTILLLFASSAKLLQKLFLQTKSSIHLLFFAEKVVGQSPTDLTSFRMQFETIGCGLLRKLFGVRGSALLAEREWGNKKGSVLEN